LLAIINDIFLNFNEFIFSRLKSNSKLRELDFQAELGQKQNLVDHLYSQINRSDKVCAIFKIIFELHNIFKTKLVIRFK
jgi:hypothetical protein